MSKVFKKKNPTRYVVEMNPLDYFNWIGQENLTKELCLEVLKIDGKMVNFIPIDLLDEEMCIASVKQDPKNIAIIRPDMLTERVRNEARKVK